MTATGSRNDSDDPDEKIRGFRSMAYATIAAPGASYAAAQVQREEKTPDLLPPAAADRVSVVNEEVKKISKPWSILNADPWSMLDPH